jgi:capsular polysaccharide biosynthesis protein
MTNNNFLDNTSLFTLLYKWRKKIITISFAAAIIAAVVSLFITNKYKSEVILFPTMNLSTGKALLNEYSDFLEIGEEQELEHMMQILESNEIKDRVIETFDLLVHYEIDANNKTYQFDLLEKYNGNVEYNITKFSSIRISVLDKDPQMAADIANEIASLIDTVMNNLQKNMAEQGYQSLIKERDFILGEIEIMEDSIDKIRAFGITHYESQSEVLNEQWAVAKIANNHSAALAIEKKLAIISKYGGLYVSVREQLNYIRGNLNHINKKINEHKLTAEDQLEHKFVLNYAIPAIKKSYPIRWLIVLTTACVSALMMIVLIALKEKLKQLKQS